MKVYISGWYTLTRKKVVHFNPQIETMAIPIKIITLNKHSANLLELLGELSKIGLEAETFDAIDGRRGFPELTKGERIDHSQSSVNRQTKLTSSEVGCYLSHLRAIRESYEAGFEQICILEDDTLPEPFLADVLNEIEKSPCEGELIRLMGLKIHRRKALRPLGYVAHLTRPLKGLCGTQGYVVNRSGMQKILKRGSSITKPIDKFYDHFWDIDLECFSIEPHAIWERDRTQSTISKSCSHEITQLLSARLRKHFTKICRSTKRKYYIATRAQHFFPNSKPKQRLGRTKRIH